MDKSAATANSYKTSMAPVTPEMLKPLRTRRIDFESLEVGGDGILFEALPNKLINVSVLRVRCATEGKKLGKKFVVRNFDRVKLAGDKYHYSRKCMIIRVEKEEKTTPLQHNT